MKADIVCATHFPTTRSRNDRGKHWVLSAPDVAVVIMDAAAKAPHYQRSRERRPISASIACCRRSSPKDTSRKTPLTKNVGVDRTPLRVPPSICSCTRCKCT